MPKPTTETTQPPRMGGPQWLALAAGTIVVCATVAILAGDALAGGKWGQDQWLGLVILSATIAFGLLRKRAASERKWASAIAFSAMFVLGTVLLVYSSMGRQDGARADRAQEAKNANSAITLLKAETRRVDAEIARLSSDLARYASVRSPAEVQAALDAVVGSGRGKVPAPIWRRTRFCAADETTRAESAEACKPVFDLRIENGRALEKARITVELVDRENERKAILAKIQAAGGEKSISSKARTFAELAGLVGFDASTVEHVVSRVDILIVTLFLEWSAIVALEYAFAGWMVARPATKAPAVEGGQPATARKLRATVPPTTVANDDNPPTPGGNRAPMGSNTVATRAAAEDDIVRLVARGEVLPTQDVLARRWGVHKGTASKWLADFERRGLVKRTLDGRAKRIAAG